MERMERNNTVKDNDEIDLLELLRALKSRQPSGAASAGGGHRRLRGRCL